MRASFFVIVLVGIVVALVAFACDEDFQACYGSDYEGCLCTDGGFGYAKCSPLGDYQTAVCVCDGTTPGIDGGPGEAAAPDATPSPPPAPGPAPTVLPSTGCVPVDEDAGDDDAGDAGDVGDAGDAGVLPKAYSGDCNTSTDCESCLCEVFADAGHCTRACTALSECPAPAFECSSGFCRFGR